MPQKYNIVLLILTLLVGSAWVYVAIEPYTRSWTYNWPSTEGSAPSSSEHEVPASPVQEDDTGLR